MGEGDVGCTPLIKQGNYLQTGESIIQSQLTDTTHQSRRFLIVWRLENMGLALQKGF